MAFNLGAGLGAFGAFSQGTRDYDVYLRQKQQQDQQIAMQQLALQQAQEQSKRDPDVAKGYLALLGQDQQTPNQISQPPPPMPGQASVPMQQPPMQYQGQPRNMNAPDPYAAADQKYGFPPGTMRAVSGVESGGNPNAVSPKGAQGEFQVMPGTQSRPGYGLPPINPNDPMSAGSYLAKMVQLSGGDFNLGLARYNAGPAGNVNNPETMNYVKRVNMKLQGGQQRPQMPPQVQQQPIQGQGQPQAQQPPQIPPYQSMANVGQQPPPQNQIPQPPKLDFQSAIKILNSQGINDPQTILAILDKNQARLNIQAQQQLNALKEQELSQYHQGMVGAAQQRANTGEKRADTAQQVADSKTGVTNLSTAGPLSKTDQFALDTQAWNYINNGKLPYRKGTGGGADRNDSVVKNAAKIAEDLGMTPQQIASMPATWKSDAASLLTQTKKLDAIESQLSSFHNNLDTWDSLAQGIAPKIGGPRVAELAKDLKKMDFTGIRTIDEFKLKAEQEFNDPTASALAVSAMAAAMDYGRIMQGPQSAASLTEGVRKDAERLIRASADEKGRKGIMAALESDTEGQIKGQRDQMQKIRDRMAGKSESPSSSSIKSTKVFSNASELQAAIKSGQIKKGDTFNDPNGNPHVVN